jgi:excisionase family DNA binding protein
VATEIRDESIGVREAAKECGRNPETIRRWIWSGKLQAEKLGNQLFVKRSALQAFCREIAAQEGKDIPRPDFLGRAMALQEKMKARGAEQIDAGELVSKMRGERLG